MVELFTELLILIGAVVLLVIGYFIGKSLAKREIEGRIKEIREEAIRQSRAVLGGQFSEQLAPYLPDFPFSPTEVRFIGKPIDFIVFKGMDGKAITEVVFVEVKSGKSAMNKNERRLRDAIKERKVRWVEYRVPEEVTR